MKRLMLATVGLALLMGFVQVQSYQTLNMEEVKRADKANITLKQMIEGRGSEGTLYVTHYHLSIGWGEILWWLNEMKGGYHDLLTKNGRH